MTQQDHERTMGQSQNKSTQAQPRDWSQSVMPRPTTVREALHLVRGDYTHGHPGMPPKDYQQPREARRQRANG